MKTKNVIIQQFWFWKTFFIKSFVYEKYLKIDWTCRPLSRTYPDSEMISHQRRLDWNVIRTDSDAANPPSYLYYLKQKQNPTLNKIVQNKFQDSNS